MDDADVYQSFVDINESNNKYNSFRIRMNEIWDNIKKDSIELQHLESKKKEVSDHYNKIIEAIIIEENRKIMIIDSYIDTIKSDIYKQVNELKHIINNQDRFIENSIEIEQLFYKDEEKERVGEDDVIYVNSIDKITQSIQQSDTLINFVLDNIDLDSDVKKKDFNIEILDYTIQHYNEINRDIIALNNNNDNNNSDEFENYLDKKYYVARNKNLIYYFSKQFQEVIQFKKRFSKFIDNTTIFSLYYNGFASFYDINRRTSDFINLPIVRYESVYSTIKVGDNIYFFTENKSKFIQLHKFSITRKSLDCVSKQSGGKYHKVSLCSDGQDFIYFIGGYTIKNDKITYNSNISRLDVNSEDIEPYLQITPPLLFCFEHSFYYNNKIYCIRTDFSKMIYIFDLTKRDMETYMNFKFLEKSRVCNDEDGNIYYLSKDHFMSFNLDSKEIRTLRPFNLDLDDYLSMFYFRENSTNASFIYYIGKHKKHFYSLQKNCWNTLHSYDTKYICLGSIII